jgi:predicted SAM-dependent methyltransferase
VNTSLKLHLGSGPVSLDGWVNIDLDAPTADMLLDLRQPLPFADGSVTHVFSEHVIEHIEYAEALSLLKEVRRVLAPSGVVRITTPDLAWLVLNYVGGVTGGWGALWQPGAPARLINEGLRSWGHCFVYDRPEMLRLFTDAGFGDVTFVNWRESADPVLAELESRPYNHEIIVEARVPFQDHPEHASEIFIDGYRGSVEEVLALQGRELEALRLLRTTNDEAAANLPQVRAELVKRDEAYARLEESHLAVAAENDRLSRALRDCMSENDRLSQALRDCVSEKDRLSEEIRALAAESTRLVESLRAAEKYAANDELLTGIADALRVQADETAVLRKELFDAIALRATVDARMVEIRRLEDLVTETIRESVARAQQIVALEGELRERDRVLAAVRRSLPGRLLMKAVKPSPSA